LTTRLTTLLSGLKADRAGVRGERGRCLPERRRYSL